MNKLLNRGLIFGGILLFLLALFYQSCLICITGGELTIYEKYVYNPCGLLNGVYVEQIHVESLADGYPSKYQVLLSTNLYRKGASPNNDPKRLYFEKDCRQVYRWEGGKIKDTFNTKITFGYDSWYLFSSSESNEKIFMYIDKLGKRHLKKVPYDSEVRNI